MGFLWCHLFEFVESSKSTVEKSRRLWADSKSDDGAISSSCRGIWFSLEELYDIWDIRYNNVKYTVYHVQIYILIHKLWFLCMETSLNPGTRHAWHPNPLRFFIAPRHIDGKSHRDHQGGIDLRSYHHVVSFSLAGPWIGRFSSRPVKGGEKKYLSDLP